MLLQTVPHCPLIPEQVLTNAVGQALLENLLPIARIPITHQFSQSLSQLARDHTLPLAAELGHVKKSIVALVLHLYPIPLRLIDGSHTRKTTGDVLSFHP